MESHLKSAIVSIFFLCREVLMKTMQNSRYNVPSIVTTVWTIWRFNSSRSKRFLFPKLPDRSGLFFNGHRELFEWGKAAAA
jgi:hypothetical protein